MHNELMNKEEYSIKSINRMIRSIMFLIRSFDKVTTPELKDILIKLADHILNIMKQSSDPTKITDSALQFYNRMIIALGPNILEHIKQLFGIILNTLNMSTFIQLIHMTHLVFQTIKESSFSFISEILPFLFSYVITIGLPSEAVSDIQKVHMDAIITFAKLIKLVGTTNILILFQFPLKEFNSLLTLFCNCSHSGIDDIRKNGIIVISFLLAASLRFNISGDKLNQVGKSSKITISPEFEPYINMLLEYSLNCTFTPIGLLSSKNPTDIQCLEDLAMLHFILYKTVTDRVLVKLAEWTVEEPYLEAIRQGLRSMLNTGTAKQYKELLKQM